MPQLRAPQILVIGSLEWLFAAEQRGQGRSTAIAITLIRTALRSPGLIFPIIDHAGGREANRMLAGIVMAFLEREPALSRAVRRSLMLSNGPQLCIDLPAPIHSWMPENWSGLRPGLDVIAPAPNKVAPQQTLWDHLSDEG